MILVEPSGGRGRKAGGREELFSFKTLENGRNVVENVKKKMHNGQREGERRKEGFKVGKIKRKES